MIAAPEFLTAGETMAMVAPWDPVRIEDATTWRVEAGGAESNVAAQVAARGHRAAWFGRLGADPLGDRVLAQLRSVGVQVDAVERDPDAQTGLYVKDPGAGVHYYRTNSAASKLAPTSADRIELGGVRLVHLSGITPALSSSADKFVEALVRRCHSAGVPVSFDVNFRAALWPVAAAAPRLLSLARACDIVFVGRDEAEVLWGCDTAEDVRDLVKSVHEVVVKDGAVGATCFVAGERFHEPSLSVDVVEEVGAGDAFAGAYLAGWLDNVPPQLRLRQGHEGAVGALGSTADMAPDGRKGVGA